MEPQHDSTHPDRHWNGLISELLSDASRTNCLIVIGIHINKMRQSDSTTGAHILDFLSELESRVSGMALTIGCEQKRAHILASIEAYRSQYRVAD